MPIPSSIPIGAIAEVIRGVTYEKSQAASEHGAGLVPLLRATNIGQELAFEQLVYVPASVVSEQQYLRLGDIVIAASSGSLSVVGKAAPLRRDWSGTFGAFCYAIRPRNGAVRPLFLSYFLQTAEYRSAVSQLAAGVNINNLKRDHIANIGIPLLPLGEQDRIVAAIEQYFTRLDDAVATLERVERNLKRYRASVLKSAVEGRLVPTEAELARQEGCAYEPASVLLDRILAERRRRWSESGKKGKYQEPTPPDTTNLPDLPEGWCWATVEQVTMGDRSSAYGVLVPGPHIADGVPLVRVGDIRDGRIDLAGMKRISRSVADQFQRTYLQGGELLISLVGSIGRTAVVPEVLAGANVARAVGVIPASESIDCRWLEHWFRSPMIQAKMGGLAHEVARKTLNLEDVRCAVVAIPPRPEQTRIVEAVSDLESVIDKSEMLGSVSRHRATRLRQAILKWAFEGRLADQDHEDEPASHLLERILVERGMSKPAKAARRVRAAKKRPARA